MSTVETEHAAEYYIVPCDIWGRGKTDDIVTRYGLDGPGIESQWGLDFPHPFGPAFGPTQSPIQEAPGVSRG
jgi:hypothetical protein